MLTSNFNCRMPRNELTNLLNDREVGLGWLVFGYHPCRVTGPENLNQPFFVGRQWRKIKIKIKTVPTRAGT